MRIMTCNVMTAASEDALTKREKRELIKKAARRESNREKRRRESCRRGR